MNGEVPQMRERSNYLVMIKARNGSVSLLKGLTLAEAKAARLAALPWHMKQNIPEGVLVPLNNGDVESATIIDPNEGYETA